MALQRAFLVTSTSRRPRRVREKRRSGRNMLKWGEILMHRISIHYEYLYYRYIYIYIYYHIYHIYILCMYMYIYNVYVYIYIYICVCIYIYICIYIYMYIMCIYIYRFPYHLFPKSFFHSFPMLIINVPKNMWSSPKIVIVQQLPSI